MKEFVLHNRFDPAKCKIDYAKELNAEQLEVVLKGDGPCLVLAGAGSGKTRTITYRVAYLIENGVSPEQILLVTFTNKAAKEMLSRVEGLLGMKPAVWGGTFHSVAGRILRQYAPAIGHTSSFTIMDDEDARDLVKMCVKDLAVDTTAKRFPSPANLISLISFSRNAGITIREAVDKKHSHFWDQVPTIERIAELYDGRKRQADAMDFDDLLILLRQLLFTNPVIRQRLADQFQYVLVDEFQDTNSVQADIVNQLSSSHRNLLVVGDDAQSIYSFRAAQIKNILSFPEAHPGAQTFRLVTNYRSTPQILDLANATIRHNRDQFPKDLHAVREGGEKPNLVAAANASQEAQYIAEQVLSLRDEGVPLREIAVLFRSSFASQALEFELARRDIPYDFRGGMKFFQRAHIKDVISHLRLVANAKDETAWMRVLGLQTGIGLTTAGKIVEQFRAAFTIDDVIMTPIHGGSRSTNGWNQLLETLKKMALSSRRPSDLVRIVVAGPYRDYLEAEYPDHADRREDLEQLALFAEGYTELSSFLEELSLTENYGVGREEGEHDDERMVLSTIHQAKGLEWDAVFVLGLVDGKFPSQRSLEEEGGLEEERRLFYVAVTRARRLLFLTYPISGGDDTLLFSQPSQFIQEVPEELFEELKLRAAVVSGAQRFAARPTERSFGQGSQGRRSSGSMTWGSDEPTIVLDSLGERKPTAAPTSFLRNIEDL